MKSILKLLQAILLTCLISLFILAPTQLLCETDEITDQYRKHSLVINNIDSGLTVEFILVLGALHLYDQGLIGGVKVNFNKGFYVDEELGPNWWEYFFEPIDLGNKQLPEHICSTQENVNLVYMDHKLTRYRNAELIQKYIQIKPHIQEEVDRFVSQNFEDHFVIGVHHRGTDKIIESPIITFENTYQYLNQMINNLSSPQREKLRIYVATDDQYFLTYLESLFPTIVIYNNFARSMDGSPLHYGTNLYSNNYQKGREVLLDSLLLSKCHMLLRPMTSAVSLLSTYFNPNMPTMTLIPD